MAAKNIRGCLLRAQDRKPDRDQRMIDNANFIGGVGHGAGQLFYRRARAERREKYADRTEIMHDRGNAAERRSGMSGTKVERRYPIGAELTGDGRVHFRVWAPKGKTLEVSIAGA